MGIVLKNVNITGGKLSNTSLPSPLCPDTTLEVNGTLEGTFAAGSTIEVNITDGVNPVTPDDVTVVGDVVTIKVPAATPPAITGLNAPILKTGITVSTTTGDDGDTQLGRDFFVFPIVSAIQQLNHFGSKWRLTGVTGGYYDRDTSQFKDVNGTVTSKVLAFPDYLVVDHFTKDWDNNLLIYSITSSGLGIPSLTWTNACNNPPATVGALNGGWALAQINMLLSLQFEGMMAHQPFAPGHGSVYIMSSTSARGGANISASHYLYSDCWYGGATIRLKSSAGQSNYFAIYVRVTNISEL
jgi:hypothetical protein